MKLSMMTAGQEEAATQRQNLSDKQLQDAVREAKEAQAAAAKYENDLEALSSAYTSLEAHAHSLEGDRDTTAGAGTAAASLSAGIPPLSDSTRRMSLELGMLMVICPANRPWLHADSLRPSGLITSAKKNACMAKAVIYLEQ